MKYTPEILVPMFRRAAALRNEMIAAGFTDNGGAIHSATRILDILGMRLNYPGLNHINDLSGYPNAEFSVSAKRAHSQGIKVKVEHVSPQRDFTRHAIAEIDNGTSDRQLLAYVREHYRLVLLTEEEMTHLNKINRTRMEKDRLKIAGITLAPSKKSKSRHTS